MPEYRRPMVRQGMGNPARVRRRPLRIVHVGMQVINAGIDNWLTGLVRYADPKRIRFLRCVVTNNLIDRHVLAHRGVPVVIGGRDAVLRAVDDCDVLMMAGPPEIGDWLLDKPPRLGVFVAHSVCNWTRSFLESSRPAVDHVVAISRQVQQAICHDMPSTVIHNGIDPRHVVQSRSREETRAALGCRDGDFLLGFVGRLSREKRPEVLVEAISRLPSHFRLLLVGWGGLRGDLLDLASRRIPGRFSVVETTDELGDYYAAMDAFCLPSEFEGFALVLLEAMMCSVPIIATPVGFVPEAIVDRVNGVVVDGSAESIAEAARLIAAYPDWASALASEGLRYARRYGYASRMAADYADLFERLWDEKYGG